jgi:alpha-D-glucose phosphate-specific phosphoglucomutase
MTAVKFGTDGWRGIIAGDFTFGNVRLCAQAVANYVKDHGLTGKGVAVGYDTRFASEDFASAAAEVVAGNGIKVWLCPRQAPTPVVSHMVLANGAAAGIVITASHNPAAWNGFKVKSDRGASAPGEIIAQIEESIARLEPERDIISMPLSTALRERRIEYQDPFPAYSRRLGDLVNLDDLRQRRMHVAVDSMYGAGAGYFRTLLDGNAVTVTEINAERNPLFPGIQPEPIARNLARLSHLVVEQGASIGLATDGDADRIGVIDERGHFLNQHQVFALLCMYLLDTRAERGPLVKTITSTTMINKLGRLYDVPVYETAVGFKYVAPLMLEKTALVGGEESGGYGFRGHVPERDAILAGLYLLDFMGRTGKTASQLLDYLYERVGPHYYDRVDQHVSPSQQRALPNTLASQQPHSLAATNVVARDTTDGFRCILEDESWLLLRLSGTEPLLRIYAEAQSRERVSTLLEEGKRLAGV